VLEGCSAISFLAFCPAGCTLAGAGSLGDVFLWDLSGGALLRVFAASKGRYVDSLAFAPDGRSFAVAADDSVVRRWAVGSGELLSALDSRAQMPLCLAFAPDGVQLATGGYDASVRVWDCASGRAAARFPGHDGLPVGCFCDGGEADAQCPVVGHRGPVCALRFCGGGVLLSASYDGTCKAWRIASRALLRTVQLGPGVYSVAFGRDAARDDKCAAFAMGQHARLGHGSWVAALEEGVARMILDRV